MLKNLFRLSFLILMISLIVQCTTSRAAEDPRISPTKSENPHSLRKKITSFAEQQLGTKYKYAGRSPKGFDCSGFMHYVFSEYDVELPTVSAAQENLGRPVELEDVRPGDLIFFRRKVNGRVFHVSLVTDNDQDGIHVIHSTSSRGVVVDNIVTNTYWKDKFATARDVLSDL